MEGRRSDSTGIINFASAFADNYTIIDPNQDAGGVGLTGMKVVLDRVDVGNSSVADASMGYGHDWPLDQILVGDYDGAAYTEQSQNIALGATLIGTGGSFVVQVPQNFNAIGLTVSIVGGAISAQNYVSGDAFVAFTGTQFQTLDPTSGGFSSSLHKKPSPSVNGQWQRIIPGGTLAGQGFSPGYYAWRILLAAAVTVTAVRIVKLLDFVEVVASGNALTRHFNHDKKLPQGSRFIPFASTADADNWFEVQYSQST